MAVRFPRRFAASFLAWLVAALLLAQGQGQLHVIVHGHATVGQHAGHEPHAGVEAEVDSAHRHADAQEHGHDHEQSDNWLLRLFAAHDDEAACRLFDQSSLGSCVPIFAAPMALLLLAGTFFDFFEAKPRLPVPTVARARGPPPVR